MRAGLRIATVVAILGVLLNVPAMAAIQHAFLVQNSGWLEPFYSDPNSQLKPLVTELVLAVSQPGDRMVLAAFNQSLPGAPSPKGLLALNVDPKTERAQVAAALEQLAVAHK